MAPASSVILSDSTVDRVEIPPSADGLWVGSDNFCCVGVGFVPGYGGGRVGCETSWDSASAVCAAAVSASVSRFMLSFPQALITTMHSKETVRSFRILILQIHTMFLLLGRWQHKEHIYFYLNGRDDVGCGVAR